MADTSAVDGFLVQTTASIVGAYVANSALNARDLPKLIVEVYRSLSAIAEPEVPEVRVLRPAVSIRKSITPAFLICLDDGMQFKSLKRHLAGLADGLSHDCAQLRRRTVGPREIDGTWSQAQLKAAQGAEGL